MDEKERRKGENPSRGILLCREANKRVVENAICDYTKPLGVATYRNADDLAYDYAALSYSGGMAGILEKLLPEKRRN